VKVRFCGVRGSTPVSGDDFARVGGHTSCIAVSTADELPTLVLDAGTGLQTLTEVFGTRPFDGAILLTHLHWDHVQGLPFCPPVDHPDARVVVAQPAQGDPLEVLSRAMSPPHFPIHPDELRGTMSYIALEAGKHQFGAFEVLARDVVHKGGRTFGYRVRLDGLVFAYVPDALDDNDDVIRELAADADLFVRGTPFVTAESARAADYGHGTAEHAAEIARRAGARQLVLTHHAPMRADGDVDRIAERVGATAAYDGMVLTLR
jgi:phosphoribosyl 1,2-cyclic phosphodiesterase